MDLVRNLKTETVHQPDCRNRGEVFGEWTWADSRSLDQVKGASGEFPWLHLCRTCLPGCCSCVKCGPPPPADEARCQCALITDGRVNPISDWDGELYLDMFARCRTGATVKVVAECECKHEFAWRSCAGCAAKIMSQIQETDPQPCRPCGDAANEHECAGRVWFLELVAA